MHRSRSRTARLVLTAAFALCIAAGGSALARKKGGGGTINTDRYDKDCVTACQAKQKDCTLDCAHASSDEESKQCVDECTSKYVGCARKCPPRKKDSY